jgi:hypothetical protein
VAGAVVEVPNVGVVEVGHNLLRARTHPQGQGPVGGERWRWVQGSSGLES